jgi:flagellar biosynthesis protein FliQ
MARHARNGAVRVEDTSVQARQVRRDEGVAEARKRFGGLDIPASLAGTLCALGLTVLLAGLLTGIGSVGYQSGIADNDTTLSAAGLIGGLAVLFLAFLAGGWVAGRMARYDGARNGLMTAVWFLILAAVVSILGAWLGDKYNFFANVHLPQWFSDNARTAKALATGILALAVMLVAGLIGGILGARYHRHVDEIIAHNRPGGVVGDRVSVVPGPQPLAGSMDQSRTLR